MGWRDFVPDSIEDKVEEGVEKVGDAIEWAGDKTADLAEEVGLDDAGDWIRDKSRSAANQLGADVSELELGQTDDPKKLIYGSVSKIRAQVSHLNDFKSSFEQVGNGLKGIGEPDGLKGKAAEAFRKAVAKEPPRWFHASAAFGKAADAMGRFAETVEWAQGQAKEALADYEHARKVSTDARNAHNKKVELYKDAVKAKQDPLPPRPVDAKDFVDPGEALATAAQDKLDSARKQRNEVAETTRTAVRAARDAAPPKPSYAEQLKDGLDYLDLAQTHLAGGVIKGTAGIVTFARALNPTDPYNLTHPAEYLTSLNSTAAGLVTMANDPWGAGRQMLDDFMKDPSEGIGKMLPELIGSKGLGSLKKVGSAAKHLDDLKVPERKGPARKGEETDGPHQRDKQDCEKRCDGTDPVDLATGRMFLPQTDVLLPGTMPLAFTRRAESGYTAGRWFGPSWSSTVDEHLEIDAEGVILVTADGLALSYPHSAPGLPVLPANGPRWPLERTPAGDYTVTDPAGGDVRRFTAPADGDHDGDHEGGADGAGEGGGGAGYRRAVIDRVEDRNGNTITFEYDEHGTPLGITHSGGYRLRFEVAEGRITALHLTGGPRVLAYGYTDGNLTEVTNSCGRPLRFTYDERARITSWTDTNDRRYAYTYDDRDRCTSQGGADGHMTLTFAYEDRDPVTGLRSTTTATPSGEVRRYLVDEAYRVVRTVGALGAVTSSAYDARGRLASRTDPLGRATVFGRDAEGRLVCVVRPDGRELTTEYDEAGRPLVQTRADRTTWRFTYDERGNRTSLTNPVGATTRYAYDTRGALVSAVDALGGTTRIRCDRAGLPVEVTDPVGSVTRYERDAFGRAVRITDALGRTTGLEWTPEGRLARRTEPDGTAQTWEYDGEGNCVRHTNALGATTTYEYGDFDLVTARTGPDGARHSFAYDASLHMTEVVNPQGMSWRYTYDAAGMPETETDFDGRTMRYVHDAAGRLVTRTDAAGQTVRLEYDVLDNRTLKETDGGVTRYEYDYSDRLAAITGPEGTVTFLRDRFGRIREETVDGRTLSRTYDELSRVVSRTTPSGATAEWTYDAAGHRTGLTTSGRRLTFARDATGRETGRRIGDALALDLVRDDLGRLLEQRVTGADGRLMQRRGYAYRADGQLLGVEDGSAGARTYELDPAGRVTAVSAAGWTERYVYDAAGNQTEAGWPAAHPGGADATGPRGYEGTRLTSAGRTRYEYDAMGRVTLRRCTRLSRKPDIWRYTWDADDRLTAVTTPDGTLWRYAYDPTGRRSAKRRMAADGVTVAEEVRFVWDGTTLCEQTTTGPGLPHAVTLTWDHQGLEPLSQTERLVSADGREIDSRFFAIVTDLIGTPQELVDETGEIAWRTRSTVWGATTWNTDARAYTPLRFPGQYFDPESGLHYNCFRYYDPETARYLCVDPLGLGPAPNASTYVTNPLMWTDALGLAPDDCPPKVGKTKEEQKAKALRDAGVPEGLEPAIVDDWVKATTPEWQGGKQLMGPDHQPIYYTEEWYELPNGDIVVFQDHWFGHQKPGEPGYQPSHVHVRPGDDPRNGQIPGAEEHYYYDLE
ncbi:putative T7SS-secreted protein [Streptomyces vinaceus]|uniref:putative T7SS-secreted protein n=1 Tax=Streptomyces vinaceus TaxID=1960 RepID=UPI003679112D